MAIITMTAALNSAFKYAPVCFGFVAGFLLILLGFSCCSMQDRDPGTHTFMALSWAAAHDVLPRTVDCESSGFCLVSYVDHVGVVRVLYLDCGREGCRFQASPP